MDCQKATLLNLLFVSIIAVFSVSAQASQTYLVTPTQVRQQKPVFATMTAQEITLARSRINGTIDGLDVEEGDLIKRGHVIAVVADEKQPLEIASVDAQLKSLSSELDLAKIELERIRTLRSTGVASQAQLDALSARVDVLTSQIASLQAQRSVLFERFQERQILAPIEGRVLKVEVTNGSVVQAGDVIAQIAAQRYVLRIKLPERHAAYLKKGQEVDLLLDGKALQKANIIQIYPLIEQGRVTADIGFGDIGDYFVGQRIKVSVPLYQEEKILIPRVYLSKRYGIDFVRLASGQEIAVQTGQRYQDQIEILSGLEAQDEIVLP